MSIGPNYLDINVVNARAGQIKALRSVLDEIAGSVRHGDLIPRPQADFLVDVLDNLVESLDGIRTYRWDHLFTDDSKERKRLTTKRKAALDKTGRIFNRAFGLAQKQGRSQIEKRLKKTDPLLKYYRLRQYGETQEDAISGSCGKTLPIDTMKRYLKENPSEPGPVARRDGRFAQARLWHRYLRDGMAGDAAADRVAALRGVSAKAVRSSVRLFDDHALMELIRRRLLDGLTLDEAQASITSEHGVSVKKAQRLCKKFAAYNPLAILNQLLSEGVSLSEAAGRVSAAENVPVEDLERRGRSLDKGPCLEFIVAQHYFLNRLDISRMIATKAI